MPRLQTACLVVAQRGAGQDRAVVHSSPKGTTVVLADGAGGRAGGAVAGELGIRIVTERLGGPEDVNMVRLIAEADAAIYADAEAGESTLVVAQIVGTRIRGASVGDSGAWLITADDFVELTADQIRKPMLGSGGACGTSFVADLGGASLIVGSDGLLKYAPYSEICSIVREAKDLQTATERLVDCVRLRSGALPDDVSVILVRARAVGV